jgi:cysteine synthase A
MTDEEVDISKSTPNYRFDVAACPMPSRPAAEDQPATPAAESFVSEVIAGAEQKVVIFALEWCEFCWSVRKVFQECDIPYRSIDLDSVEYQKDDWGGQIRAALRERVDARTVPQIFVGGEHVGGCTETLDALKAGNFQELLKKHGVAYNREIDVDPYSFFPAWLHPR